LILEVVVTKEYTNLILETMNDKFQQMLECFSVLDTRIDRFEERLTEKIEIVDAKLMGLSRRVDSVVKNLSAEIVEVRDELRAHRENVELHAIPKKRVLKKVV